MFRPSANTDIADLKLEFRRARGLVHPHVVELHELHVTTSASFYTMEVMRHGTLAQAAASVKLQNRQAWVHALLPSLAAGLNALHDFGLFHGDVKPDNAMFGEEVSPRGVRWLDFGLSGRIRPLGGDEPASGGTLAYMAPETMLGEPCVASDAYSLGMTIYELVTGELPYDPAQPDQIRRRLAGDLAPNWSGWSPALRAIVAQLLEREPDARPELASLATRDGVVLRRRTLRRVRAVDLVARAVVEGELVNVVGARGLGKTSLLQALALELPDHTIVVGRGGSREDVRYVGLDELRDELSRSLQPEAQQEISPTSPVSRTTRAPVPVAAESWSRDLALLAARVAKQRPVVLVIDDVDLLDTDSARILAELTDDPTVAEIALVVTGCRPVDLDHHCVEVRLEPWSLDETLAHVQEELLGARSEDALALAKASGGHPGVLDELLQAWVQGELKATDLADLNTWWHGRYRGLTREERCLLTTATLAVAPMSASELALASGLGSVAVDLVWALHGRRLLDVGRVGPAHRLAGAVMRDLNGSALETLHRSIAGVLATRHAGDPLALSHHLLAAGDTAEGARQAKIGAEGLASIGAWSRAAAWMARAVDAGLTSHPDQLFLAHCLRHAGRAHEAAVIWSRLARHAARDDLHVQAIDGFLAAGDLQAGLAALQHTQLPPPTRPLLAVALEVVALAWEGRRPRPHEVGAAAASDLAWTAAKGLLYLMPLQGTWFLLRSIRMGRRSDPARTARATAALGAILYSQIPMLRQWGASFLEDARRWADATSDPYFTAMTDVWGAFAVVPTSRWHEVLLGAERGITTLEAHTEGTSWERVVASGIAVIALQRLGRVPESTALASRARARARANGDVYGQVLHEQALAYSDIAAGDTLRSRQRLAACEHAWGDRPDTVPAFYTVWLQAWCDLYDGQVAMARERFDLVLPHFLAARGYQAPMSRLDMCILEARIVLAEGTRSGRRRARKLAGMLAGGIGAESRAFADVVRAALAAADGRSDQRALERAHAAFDGSGMAASADAVAWVLARQEGGPVPRLNLPGVSDGPRWAAVYLPGFMHSGPVNK